MATYWENSCSFGLRYVSWYKYLIVSLVFSHLGLWSGNLFLIAPFPDLCLLVPFFVQNSIKALPTLAWRFHYETQTVYLYPRCDRLKLLFLCYIILIFSYESDGLQSYVKKPGFCSFKCGQNNKQHWSIRS